MKKSILISAIFLIGIAFAVGMTKCGRRAEEPVTPTALPAPQAKGSSDIKSAFINVADKIGPAVVAISTERTHKVSYGGPVGRPRKRSGFGSQFEDQEPLERFFEEFFGPLPDREYKQKGLGSGFIIDKEGHILTNHHVIEGADKINITLPDGRTFPGVLKGQDPRSDLAVIKIKAKNLPVAELGDSEGVRIGEWVVALGNPFGHVLQSPKPTVTSGIISALHRRIPMPGGDRGYLDMIQTDAAINVGNSGGPLCDLDGRVIAINVAIFSTSGGYQGVGFAIPSNAAKKILEDLKEGKEISHGWFGVSIQGITPDIAEYFNLPDRKGVLISEIIPESPAEKAGLTPGDIIKAIEGKPINEMQDLLREIGRAKIGQEVRAEIIRDRVRKSINVTVGKRPSRAQLEEGGAHLPSEEIEAWRGIKATVMEKEVVIMEITPGSPSDEAGLSTGDVIREINKTKINSPAEYKKITGEARGLALVRTDRGYFTVKDNGSK